MPTGPQRKQPKPEGRFSESTDYNTGRRTVFHEIDVPGRQSHEPHSIRAQATEIGDKKWAVRVVHGPHETRDATGSYYNQVGDFTHEGTLSSLKPVLRRTTGDQWKGLRTPDRPGESIRGEGL